MRSKDEKILWDEYRESEMSALLPHLKSLGITLETEQPHTIGERYLMQALTTQSGKKLILLGTRGSDGGRVVIKATRDKKGVEELLHARRRREVLHKIKFAYQAFFSPEEVFFGMRGNFLISAQLFIEQEKPFLERPLREQFFLALKAFKAQESAHATTYGHMRLVRKHFGTRDAHGYLAAFAQFQKDIVSAQEGRELEETLRRGSHFLKEGKEVIEQYSGFLTHTDFVPHNIRVVGKTIYLLDHSSLRFGNKYEGWARFINFMELYNPPLAKALTDYVTLNRAPEESLSLQLMRVYRLGEIIYYYVHAAERSLGDLKKLNASRVDFWSAVLRAVLENKALPSSIRENYISLRDSLRSEEEKRRQIGLH